jgi:hypothetical protein
MIELENTSVGRINAEEARNDPDIFRKKVEAKIYEIMDRYQCEFKLTEFSWINGEVNATVVVVLKEQQNG